MNWWKINCWQGKQNKFIFGPNSRGVYFLENASPTYEKKYRSLVSWYFLPKILPKWFLELINPCLEYNGVLVPLDPLSRVNWTTLVWEPILTKTNRNYSFLIYLYKKVEIYFYENKKLNRNLRPSAGKRRKSPLPPSVFVIL